VFFILGAGALAVVFFVVVKPHLAELSQPPAENSQPATEDTNKNAGPEATPVAEASQPDNEIASFVPPPNSVEFINSKDKLDGKAGMQTRAALGAYQKSAGLKLDCWPSEAVLRSMSGAR